MSVSRTSGRHDLDAEGCCVICHCHAGSEFGTMKMADGREIMVGVKCTKGSPRAEVVCPGPGSQKSP